MTQWDFLWKTMHDLMPLNSIGSAIVSIIAIAFVIAAVWQKSGIPGKPLTKIARAFGKSINEDLERKVDDLGKKVDRIQEEQGAMKAEEEKKEALAARTRILRFNDELLNGIKHTEKMFDEALDDCTRYNRYCEDHPKFSNDRTHEAEKNIKRVYHELMEEHGFL